MYSNGKSRDEGVSRTLWQRVRVMVVIVAEV